MTGADLERLEQLETELAMLRGQIKCIRCMTPPPPAPRWPGDPWCTDTRPPHTCGSATA